MSKNIMGKVLDLLGIVEGVEYDLVFEGGRASGSSPLTRSGDYLIDELGTKTLKLTMSYLLTGECELVPRQWAPEPCEKFYYIDICDIDGTGYYTCHSVAELELLIKRGVAFYRTHDEALQAVEEKYNSGEWER